MMSRGPAAHAQTETDTPMTTDTPNETTGPLSLAPCSAVPSVALPLKLRLRGNDAWIEDADGREAVSRTCGFESGAAHEQWLRWIVRAANATLKPNVKAEPRP